MNKISVTSIEILSFIYAISMKESTIDYERVVDTFDEFSGHFIHLCFIYLKDLKYISYVDGFAEYNGCIEKHNLKITPNGIMKAEMEIQKQ